MGKKRNDIVSFLYKVFLSIFLPEKVYWLKMPGVDKVRERRIKEETEKKTL